MKNVCRPKKALFQTVTSTIWSLTMMAFLFVLCGTDLSAQCMVTCPSNIVTQAGANGTAAVNVPAVQTSGGCNQFITDYSGVYPIGVTEITVLANTSPEVFCSFTITVNDNSVPVITGCANVTETLESGECGFLFAPFLGVSDNGTNIAVETTQNTDFEVTESVGCPGGVNRVFRVFETDDFDIDTEFELSEIQFGVATSGVGSMVQATVYLLDGAFPGGTWEEVATAQKNLPMLSNTLASINIDADIPANSTFIVELSTMGALFNGLAFGANTNGETNPSYIESAFCGIPSISSFDMAGLGGQALVMNLVGEEKDVVLNQVGNTTYTWGDYLPIGIHSFSFEAVDASGNVSNCDFSVTINPYPNPIGSISCNDLVNISLDENCEAEILADQILEGNQYGCYDDYVVTLENAAGVQFGNMINASMIGMTLKARVTAPNGNSCWGNIVIEDKGGAPLECPDIYTTCTGSTEPGSPIASRVTFLGNVGSGAITAAGPGTYDIAVDVFGLPGATITDVNVVLDIDHTNISELSATVSAPDGTTIPLFVYPPAACDGDNFRVTFDAQAMYDHAQFLATCEPVAPAVQGAFQPLGNLSTLNSKSTDGTWIITINDNMAGNGGTINNANLVFTQSGGTIAFPTANDVTFTQTGTNQYNVNGIDACGPVNAVYTDDVELQECTSPYSEIIFRTWNVTDAQGNNSIPCTQVIYVFRNDLSTLVFPPNYDGIQLPALSCRIYGDVVPDSTVTGYPEGDFCDNVQIFPYEDQRIDVCPKSYKIIRRWRLLEWCSGDVIEHNQIIKVVDDEGPLMGCPDDETVSAEPFDCYANYTPVKPTIFRECSPNVSYEVGYILPDPDGNANYDGTLESANVVTIGNNFVIRELPLGTSIILWRVYDECGNYSQCTYEVTVVDNIPPVAVCDEHTVVSIGSDGVSYVKAITFDDLSLDNCGIEKYEARKMTDQCQFGTTEWTDELRFCCAEVGTTVMVSLRVTDVSGNSNTCMVEVRVDDKLPPYITECPSDITLDCQADYDDLNLTGEPTAIDNCEIVSVSKTDVVDIDQCGRGLVRRTWTVEDPQGFKASCEQRIRLVDSDPFDSNDIRWPRNYDATTCDVNLDPENLPAGFNVPTFADDVCSLVAVDYEDQKFTFVEGSCEKILRRWVVIDWCTYDPDETTSTGNPPGYYTYTQIIKLENTQAPTFADGCAFSQVCSYGNCGGEVTLTKNATDDCTPEEELNWTWRIDINNDGTYDRSGLGNTITIILNDNIHGIEWKVEDKCGNINTCKTTFEVRDCKKPTPYCLSSIVTVVMPSSGSVAVWASDFNFGSYDNCTDTVDLRYSFSTNVNNTSRTFTCADIPDGKGAFIPLRMYVTDRAGNKDYCSVDLILQDGIGDICDGTGALVISGSVELEDGTLLPKTQVIATNTQLGEQRYVEVDDLGNYSFTGLPTGMNYTIKAENNTNHGLGVSTLDLVLMQRHILNIKQFDSPYDVIAADVDNNQSVSGADVVILRKLILGIINEFPNGQESWRFTDKSTTMSMGAIFPYDDKIVINNLQNSYLGQDFVAVKIGDVNGSADLGLKGESSETRSGNTIALTTERLTANKGETVEVPVYAADINTLTGMQMSFSYNAEWMSFNGVKAGQINLSEDMIALLEAGTISMVWAQGSTLDIDTDQPLFSFVFDMKQSIENEALVSLSNEGLKPEAYNESLEVSSLTLGLRGAALTEFSVAQNTPNPFDNETNIAFFTPTAKRIALEVRDVNGKLIWRQAGNYTQGNHTITLNTQDLQANGMLFYTLSDGEQSITKRMVAIR